jgi:hypothetical protein
VHRALGQQGQDGRPDIAAAATPASATPAVTAASAAAAPTTTTAVTGSLASHRVLPSGVVDDISTTVDLSSPVADLARPVLGGLSRQQVSRLPCG